MRTRRLGAGSTARSPDPSRQPNGLLELVLEVASLDHSVNFYRDLLQLPEVERWPEPRSGVWLSIGRNAVLGLWPATSGGPGVGIAGSRGAGALMSLSGPRLALSVGPISTARERSPATAAARTGAAFSPTPPVKTSASRPFIAAAIEAMSARRRWM